MDDQDQGRADDQPASDPEPSDRADTADSARFQEPWAERGEETADLDAASGAAGVPARIGEYSIRSVIASGGMGIVYLAHQERPRRPVALKVMRRGIASRSALRRFEYESQILARLRHPNIAQVYDAGTHDDGSGGVPYFVMEYVPGARTLTEFARRGELPTRERLGLFTKVCDAVHHGHQKGIIHRDLKPSNILVDSAGEPKIIDFGVARATDSDMAITTLQTDVGQLIGTLQYMSPEQCEADPHDLDIRSDVYALGVVLYELLTERLPYDVGSAAIHEAARMIREDAPARPSSIDRTLRGDVETITLKALEKARERRYQSAADLAHDITRYLGDQPIEARPPSLVYQFTRLARRHQAAFAAAAFMALVLVAATVVSLLFARNATIARRAEAQRGNELRAEITRRTAAERDLQAAVVEATRQAYLANVAAADAAIDVNALASAERRLDQAPAELRNWEWHALRNGLDESVATIGGFSARELAVTPDGRLLVGVGTDRSGSRIAAWDATTLAPHWSVPGPPPAERARFTGLAVSPDSATVATGYFGREGQRVAILDARTGRELDRLVTGRSAEMEDLERGEGTQIEALAFSPDGRLLVVGTSYLDPERELLLYAMATVWEVGSGALHARLNHDGEGGVHSIAFGPDGATVATGAMYDTAVKIWSVADGRLLRALEGHAGTVNALHWTDDGRIVSGSLDGSVRVWDAASGAIVATMRDRVQTLAVRPDGRRVAVASELVRVWDLETGELEQELRGHRRGVACVAYPAEGGRLYSGGQGRPEDDDDGIKVWEPATHGHPLVIPECSVTDVAWHPRAPEVAAGFDDGTVRVISATTGRARLVLEGHRPYVRAVAFRPDGQEVAAVGDDRSIRIWSLRDGSSLRVIEGAHVGLVTGVRYGPDGATLATRSFAEFKLWDADTGALLHVVDPAAVLAIAYTADGSAIAYADTRGSVRFVDVVTGAEVDSIVLDPTVNDRGISARLGRAWGLNDILFDGDARMLTAARGGVTVWSLEDREQIRRFEGQEGRVESVALSPDGTRLFSSGHEPIVRVWDVETGDQVMSLRGLGPRVRRIALSSDGTRLAAVSDDRALRIWSAAPADAARR